MDTIGIHSWTKNRMGEERRGKEEIWELRRKQKRERGWMDTEEGEDCNELSWRGASRGGEHSRAQERGE